MSSGDPVTPSSLPNRVQTTSITANSSTVTTTETSIATVIGGLVAGRVYTVWALVRGSSTVAADTMLVRLREDTVTGTEAAVGRIYVNDTDAAACGPCLLIAQYTAVATGSKTFALCITRRTGTGSVSVRASATAPGLLAIDALAT